MLEKILSTLDLNEEEVKTYLQLLEIGPNTVGNLAKKLGMPRPSLYGFLKRLQEKGLVVESLKMGVKTFSAEVPEKIALLFQQKIEDLQNKEKLYRELLPELRKKQPLKLVRPKFQLFEGEEGVRNAAKDLLLYRNIETQSFWPIKAMLDILSPDFFRYFNKERIKSNIYVRAIWPEDQIVDVKKHPYLGVGEKFKREVRIAPKGISFSMGYWIWGNKAAFISSRKESFGFIIESAELKEMLLAQFEVIWKISKPLTVDPKDTGGFLKELES